MVSKADVEMRALNADERQDVMASLKTIEQRSKSLKEFVTNFRSVNQVPDPVVQPMSLQGLIDEAHALFSREGEKENIVFVIARLKAPYTIQADRNLTMQVMINLIKNAIEAMANMKEDKAITLSAERMGRYVNLSIADTGCGISPDDIEQIFIPFYSTKKSGSGIGLSISQQIMQKQRGDITVRSVPGKGTEFILTFCS